MLALIFVTIIEISLAWYGYRAWFRPSDYMQWVHASRTRAGRVFPFVMKLWTVRQLTKNSQVDLWWARLVSLALFLLCTILWMTALAEVILKAP